MSEIFDVIADVIVDVADIDKEEITEDSEFMDTLDLSSLEIMSIISRIEKEYSIKIDEKELLSITTVKDLEELVASKKQ
ncbi:acyl carrier protein [Butyrivibrio sp. INlla16]|uniref:acyl carrier protein n=1 Tax=Butyrivibrio sp. INlla16 TaxID=1520807 RepID=UPI000884CAAF|nr:phosphopantetheine-binding protein [Butyrivibrio sp. INlla16]SDB68562.1 acyl carrier protein [Butyrivibrio sp. INlla16]